MNVNEIIFTFPLNPPLVKGDLHLHNLGKLMLLLYFKLFFLLCAIAVLGVMNVNENIFTFPLNPPLVKGDLYLHNLVKN